MTLLFITPAITLALAVYAWRQRGRPAARFLAIMLLAMAVWSAAANMILVVGPDLAAMTFWYSAQYLGALVIPVGWLAFTLAYAGHAAWLTLPRLAALSVVPALTLVLALSYPWHDWMWSAERLVAVGSLWTLKVTPEAWYWVSVVYGYGLILAGGGVLVLTSRAATPAYRRQAATLLVGASLPLIPNLLLLLGRNPFPIDLTPTAFALSGLVVAWALFRGHLLELAPFARTAFFENIADAVLVLDAHNAIVDLNPAARRLLGARAPTAIGQTVRAALPDLGDQLPDGDGTSQVLLPDGERPRHFEARRSSLRDGAGGLLGRLLVLHDITEDKRAEAELRAQKELFENLVQVARATAARPTLTATLRNTLQVTNALTGAERGSLFLLDASGRVTTNLLVGGRGEAQHRPSLVHKVMDTGLAGWVSQHRRPARVLDTLQDQRWLAFDDQAPDTRSVLCVPIQSGGELLGILTLIHSRPGYFTDEHTRLLQAAGDQIALALRNAAMFDAQQRMAERQATLYGVLRALEGQVTGEAVAQAAADAIVRYTGWPNVAIALLTDDGRGWRIQAAAGALALTRGVGRPLGEGVIGRALTQRQTQRVADVAADAAYLAGQPATRSELATPIQNAGRCLGVLNVESDQPAAFNADDAELAESLADAVGLALENARLFQAEAGERGRLEALIKASQDGIILIAPDRTILVINAAALRLLGLPGQPEDWIARSLLDAARLLRRRAPQAVRAILYEVRRDRAGDGTPGAGEAEIPPYSVLWSNSPVRVGGSLMGRLIVARDITETRQAEHLRTDLTRMMVHDLRNPLNNLDLSLDLLQTDEQGALSAGQRDMLATAQASTQRMLKLVNAILDVSRLESGQLPLRRQDLALAPLVADALQRQAPLAELRALRLVNALPAELPAVAADPALLERVLQNLVGNAPSVTPEGGAVTVRAEAAAGHVCVAVTDTGPGLAPDLKGRLFQKFATGRPGGTGLGLAFCRLVVEAHGGRIWAESEPGQGATFFFTLPTADGAVALTG